MKKIYKLTFIALILLLLPALSYPYTLDSIRISLLQGDTQIKPEDMSDWAPVSINMPLKEGDRLWVPEAGRVELQLRDGTCVRLDEYSALEILTADEDSFQLYLTKGHAYVNFPGLSDGLSQIDTPLSSIRAFDRSKFRIDVNDDGYTKVSVITGAVYSDSRNGETRVSAGKTLSIGEDLFAELSPLGPSDKWERWNTERDRRLNDERYSQRYLPEELDTYAYDFDENGRWVYTSDYGYVWTPTVIISTGWAPYRVGRWSWIGGDYVWVSYEPWGWVPYHYGRWTHIISIGWVWVPPLRGSVYWGPGFVGWVHTPACVAWLPLAPGDTYYGYGYYGPGSVNIININVNKIVVKGHYKNAHVHNSVTAVSPYSFVKDKYIYETSKVNPFLANRINIGRPQIKPEKSSYLTITKEIPKTHLPPQKISDVKIKELKKERLLVKEKKAPVMKTETAQKIMPVRIFNETKNSKTMLKREKELFPSGQPQVTENKPLPKVQMQSSIKVQKPEIKSNKMQSKPIEPFIEKKQQKAAQSNKSRPLNQKTNTNWIQKEDKPKVNTEVGKNEEEVKSKSVNNKWMQDTGVQTNSGLFETRTPGALKRPLFR
ncbi:MAG: hypothetical protein A2Y97_07665 [Nitrospirae bacterium RBG_13_39_12]|nr:MAG: hypothetical protein A2Y97_07665 [Nitrospirae bacterium RBG_13_39_12]